jgi:hypothetical protein
MNLNVFISLDLEKISKLKFIERTVPYMYSETKHTSGPIYYGIIHIVSNENYDKLADRFEGTDYKIQEKDKVYVLPNCSIPQFKIKEFLKQKNASFTSDYMNATVYLGSKNCLKMTDEKCDTVNVLGAKTYYNLYCSNTKPESATYASGDYKSIYDNARELFMNRKMARFTDNFGSDDKYFLLPLGASIVYNILAHKVPVVSEESFLEQGTEACILTEELYYSVKDMLASEDESNQLIALQTVANCNIEKSKVYIYFLAREFGRLFINSRFKNIKLFCALANISTLQSMSGGEFMSKLLEENPEQLTPEIFKQILVSETDAFVERLSSDLFDIVIIPKRKFAKFHDNLTFTYELDEE